MKLEQEYSRELKNLKFWVTLITILIFMGGMALKYFDGGISGDREDSDNYYGSPRVRANEQVYKVDWKENKYIYEDGYLHSKEIEPLASKKVVPITTNAEPKPFRHKKAGFINEDVERENRRAIRKEWERNELEEMIDEKVQEALDMGID